MNFQPAPVKPTIAFDAVDDIDIRVGEIVEVLNIAKSHTVMKLVVDFGDHTRSILAGIKKERVAPQELIGMQALFVLNIPTKEMLGEVSEGMLFDLGFEDNIKPALAIPENPVPNGTRAG